MHRERRALRFTVAVLATALGLVGCGGSSGTSPTAPFQATLSGYADGLAKHNAVEVCGHVTPAFWQAMAGQIDNSVASSGGAPLAGQSCLQGLHYLFTRIGAPTATRSPNLAIRNLEVHASRASAIITDGSTREPTRFVRSSSGQWQLDCCTGAQLNHLPSTRYRLPSVSMEPTLKYGEIVTADNTVLRMHPPSLEEIVTVHPPAQTTCADPSQGEGFPAPCGSPQRDAGTELVIKRVVGLPGDSIAIVDGHVLRNGAVLREPYITPCRSSLCEFRKPIVVPPGTYFLLGDNRGNSFDSRFYGPVRRGWIVGVVER